MSAIRILLVEYLDAAGAAPRDVRERAATLNHAGALVRSIVVTSDRSDALHPSPPASTLPHVPDTVRGRRALEALIAEAKADRIVIASAAPGGGEVGCWLAGRDDVRWWPAAIGAADGGAHPSLFDPDPAIALDTTPIEHARLKRGQLPLWDGDYVLAPAPLGGEAGEVVIDAFANLCDASDGLDLVVLGDPQRVFERRARAKGVGFRVHFAGEAPRDAETAWLTSARAAVVGGDAPLAAGTVLRALARGCPLLAPASSPTGRSLEAWLARHGCAVGGPEEPFASRLARAVERDAALDAVLERGRALAANARAEALAGAFAAVLDGSGRARRAA